MTPLDGTSISSTESSTETARSLEILAHAAAQSERRIPTPSPEKPSSSNPLRNPADLKQSIAQALNQMNRDNAADMLEDFKKIIDMSPGPEIKVLTYVAMAKAYLLIGAYEDMYSACNKALLDKEKVENDLIAEAYQLKGDSLVFLNKNFEALYTYLTLYCFTKSLSVFKANASKVTITDIEKELNSLPSPQDGGPSDAECAKALLYLACEEMHKNAFESACLYFEKHSKFEVSKKKIAIASAYHASCLFKGDKLDEAEALLKKALEFAEDQNQVKCRAYSNLALIYYKRSTVEDLKKSVAYSLEAQKYSSTQDDSNRIENQLKCAHDKLQKLSENVSKHAEEYHSTGLKWLQKEKFSAALIQFNKALEKSEDGDFKSKVLLQKGKAFIGLKKYSEAEEALTQARALSKHGPRNFHITENLRKIQECLSKEAGPSQPPQKRAKFEAAVQTNRSSGLTAHIDSLFRNSQDSFSSQQFAKGAQEVNTAIEEVSKQLMPRLQILQAKHFVGLNNIERAQKILNEVLETAVINNDLQKEVNELIEFIKNKKDAT